MPRCASLSGTCDSWAGSCARSRIARPACRTRRRLKLRRSPSTLRETAMFAFLRKAPRTERRIERQRRRYYVSNNLRSLYAAFRLARNPHATKYVFLIGDTQDNIAESERQLGRYPDPFQSDALEALWQSGYRAERYDLDELAKLPAHTLGGAYARHMRASQLQLDYY